MHAGSEKIIFLEFALRKAFLIYVPQTGSI